MDTFNTVELRDLISKVIEREFSWMNKQDDGTYTEEIYADYRDEMSDKDVTDILSAEDPENQLMLKMYEWYDDVEFDAKDKIVDRVVETVSEKYPEVEDVREKVEDLVTEMVFFEYPCDHFMNQEFDVDIMMDTGDGNYDYTLNAVAPCYYQYYNTGDIDNRASIMWLATQQGYTKRQLTAALKKKPEGEPKGFLESMYVELNNLLSHMSTLTFLVRMTLADLIKLNRLIKLQDREGHFWDATKNPECGMIVLSKRTECGLYDPWAGGGSMFEIQLEKDVDIPIKYIRSAVPDGCDGYAVKSVYGMTSKPWTRGQVVDIKCADHLHRLVGFCD